GVFICRAWIIWVTRVPGHGTSTKSRLNSVFWRYPARLLERCAFPAFLGATPARTARAAPDQVPEAEENKHGSDGTQPGDQVVDRGHEIVRRVAQSRREAPAVRRRVRRRRAGFGQRHGDRAEGDVVVDVLDLTL